jgi:hypothetical protein
MAQGKDALPRAAPAREWIEIAGEELREYKAELRALLELTCRSPIFHNSPRSCEFIRHVVHHSLSGDVDELKERLIGITLLGREPSYDTSTDSGVRVRANDVRKRLTRFNETEGASLSFSMALPPGSYIPRFYRPQSWHSSESSIAAPAPPVEESMPAVEALPPAQVFRRLTRFQLAAPTLAAIFLCIISMRWQLSQENSFAHFWQRIFQGDRALLYLKTSHANGGQGLVAIQELSEAAPLLDLAGQFHRQLTVMSSPAPNSSTDRVILHVGIDAGSDLHAATESHTAATERFQLITSQDARVIVDRKDPGHAALRRAALITIIGGPQSSIYIDGTDDEAIQSLVTRLCDERTFPESLADSLHAGAVTQAVFPLETYARGIFDRAPLAGHAAVESLP